jgi:surface antigen
VFGASLLIVGLASTAAAQIFPWQRHREGLGLSREDLALQRQAVQRALEDNADGEPLEWKNPENDHTGSVTPLRSYERDGRRCRQFRLRASTHREGELQQRACRHDDGSWKTY